MTEKEKCKLDNNKLIAKRELEVIGGNPQIFRYHDKNDEKFIDIFSSKDRPYNGVCAYATIGLSEYDIGMISNNKNLRIELLGACDGTEILFPNIMATTAFEIMESGNCGYGHIIPDVISNYMDDLDMKHMYLMNPFLWDGFDTIKLENKMIAWLLCIPISEQEKEFAIMDGYDLLETKFEEANIDIFNLKRKSIF